MNPSEPVSGCGPPPQSRFRCRLHSPHRCLCPSSEVQRSYVSHSHSCFVRPQVPAQPTAVAFSRTLTAHHRIAAAQQPAVDADARRSVTCLPCLHPSAPQTRVLTLPLFLLPSDFRLTPCVSARSSMSLSGGSAWGAGVGGVGGVGGAGGAAGGASTADERPRLRVVAFSAAAGKATSGASGERLRVGGEVDPACHSFVQRSWLPDRQHFHSYLSERIDCWTQSTDAAVPSP